jgi:hypothetical protein
VGDTWVSYPQSDTNNIGLAGKEGYCHLRQSWKGGPFLPLCAAPAWSVSRSVFPQRLVVHTLAALTLFLLTKGADDTAKAEMTHRGVEHLR